MFTFTSMIREENIRIIFGLKIKQLRQEKKRSQLELAKLVRLSPSYLNEIEKGKKYPKADKIVAFAEVFGVSYDELVSLKMLGPLAPLTDLLHSNLITDLPLNIFGFDLGKMVESLPNSPVKVGAFISTIVEIARNYEQQKERFYFAALRSYQELYNNYFEEMEAGCDIFVQKFNLDTSKPFHYENAKEILTEKYNYLVEEYSLEEYPELESNRYVYVPGKDNHKLLLNPKLNTNQRLFVVGRELAFNILKVQKRSPISMLVEVNSFDHILNNFLGTYCAAGVLINRDRLVNDLTQIFQNKEWDDQQFLSLLAIYKVSPEVLINRISGVVSHLMEIKDLFYLRFQHNLETDKIELTKEIYLGTATNPDILETASHCRRFVGIKLLKQFQQNQEKQQLNDPIIAAQITQNISTEEEYFCISIARDMAPTPKANSSVTIGFKINTNFKRKVNFWNDRNVEQTLININCESCALENCAERVAEPTDILKQQEAQKVKDALDKLQRSFM